MHEDVRYTAPRPVNGFEAFDFALFDGSREINVRVSREAVEDYALKQGLPAAVNGDQLLGHMEMFQPEFVQAARHKYREVETVLITSEDVAA